MGRAVVPWTVLWSLACGGLQQAADSVVDRASDVAAEQVERAVEQGLGLPPDAVDIERKGDRWTFDLPQGSGDCALGGDASVPKGFPSVEGPLLAECKVAVDCVELTGSTCPEGLGDDVRVVARRLDESVASAVAARRRSLRSQGLEVTDMPAKGGTVLIASKGRKVKAVAWVGELDGTGRIELVGVPR